MSNLTHPLKAGKRTDLIRLTIYFCTERLDGTCLGDISRQQIPSIYQSAAENVLSSCQHTGHLNSLYAVSSTFVE